MSWKIVPTRIVPILHRMESGAVRHHGDMMSQIWRSFDKALKDFDAEGAFRRFDKKFADMGRSFGEFGVSRHVRNQYVTDEAGKMKLQLRYDVSKCKPEDIKVKMAGNKLMVNVKQMKHEAGEKWYSEFSREFEIPKEVEITELKSALTPDGILTIEAPVNETKIPIEFTKEGELGEKN